MFSYPRGQQPDSGRNLAAGARLIARFRRLHAPPSASASLPASTAGCSRSCSWQRGSSNCQRRWPSALSTHRPGRLPYWHGLSAMWEGILQTVSCAAEEVAVPAGKDHLHGQQVSSALSACSVRCRVLETSRAAQECNTTHLCELCRKARSVEDGEAVAPPRGGSGSTEHAARKAITNAFSG